MTPHDSNPVCPDEATADSRPGRTPETVAQAFYRTLTDAQKRVICFDWDYHHPVRGLLRGYAYNFWHITRPMIGDDFYSREQRALLFDIFKGLINPDWHARILKQLKEDHDGAAWGEYLSCGVFGQPDTGRFQLVMTGRHHTIRVDGDSDSRLAFGGPIVHGHAPGGSCEGVNHPGNVFWRQRNWPAGSIPFSTASSSSERCWPSPRGNTRSAFAAPTGSGRACLARK